MSCYHKCFLKTHLKYLWKQILTNKNKSEFKGFASKCKSPLTQQTHKICQKHSLLAMPYVVLLKSFHKFKVWITPLKCGFFAFLQKAQNDKSSAFYCAVTPCKPQRKSNLSKILVLRHACACFVVYLMRQRKSTPKKLLKIYGKATKFTAKLLILIHNKAIKIQFITNSQKIIVFHNKAAEFHRKNIKFTAKPRKFII